MRTKMNEDLELFGRLCLVGVPLLLAAGTLAHRVPGRKPTEAELHRAFLQLEY